jgi:hypothetical protein
LLYKMMYAYNCMLYYIARQNVLAFVSCPSMQDSTSIACQGELVEMVLISSVLVCETGVELWVASQSAGGEHF